MPKREEPLGRESDGLLPSKNTLFQATAHQSKSNQIKPNQTMFERDDFPGFEVCEDSGPLNKENSEDDVRD
jgi:hypothetical protein